MLLTYFCEASALEAGEHFCFASFKDPVTFSCKLALDRNNACLFCTVEPVLLEH